MPARLTAEQLYLRSISEAAWQRVVQGIADVAGWLSYHAPDNRPRPRRGGGTYVQNVRAGFPDLVLVKGPRIVYAELKTETGKPTPDQLRWLRALATAGADVAVWRPSDQAIVEGVLLRGAAVPPWPTA